MNLIPLKQFEFTQNFVSTSLDRYVVKEIWDTVKEIWDTIPRVMKYYGIDELPEIKCYSNFLDDRVGAVNFSDFSVEFNVANMKSVHVSDNTLNAITYLSSEQINSFKENYTAFIVAHEFCHFKQMRSRRMYLTENKRAVIWAETGKEYWMPSTLEAYVELPWEKEANIEANNYIQTLLD